MKRFFFENYLFGGIVVPNVVVCVFHSKSNHLHGTLPSVLLKKVFWLEMNLTQISHLSDIAIKNGRPRPHKYHIFQILQFKMVNLDNTSEINVEISFGVWFSS